MRMMLKFTVPAEVGNRAIKDGRLAKVLQSMMSLLRPEASYFYPVDGRRGGLFVFDMKDSSEIPSIAEQMFAELEAELAFTPVMNREDLEKGLSAVAKMRA